MKIAFCVIVKDDSELEGLQNLCNSVVPFVDSVHITANGKDVEKIREYVTSNKWDYSYLPWGKNFSDQRNYNFSRAPKDTDYIFWCDADDVVLGGEHLRPLAQLALDMGKDCVFLTYWYGCFFNGKPTYENLMDVELVQTRERLLRVGATVWKKRIHETPVEIGHDFTYTKHEFKDIASFEAAKPEQHPIVVMHTGADRNVDPEKLKARDKRNREILGISFSCVT